MKKVTPIFASECCSCCSITQNHFIVRMRQVQRSAQKKALFSRQSAVVAVYRKKSPDGLYLGYYPFGDLRDVPQMRHYHAKIYIFLPTLVRLAPLAAEALAAVFLGVAVLVAFFSSPSSVFLRERRVLGLASAAGAAAVGATPVV